jgi:hypothetical protein
MYDPHLTKAMKYNVTNNTIKFNHMQINGYKTRTNLNISDEEFALIILYHEMGHYLDFKENKYNFDQSKWTQEEKRLFMQEREINAWKYGRTLVSNELLKLYDKIQTLDKRLTS